MNKKSTMPDQRVSMPSENMMVNESKRRMKEIANEIELFHGVNIAIGTGTEFPQLMNKELQNKLKNDTMQQLI